jgi:hypothetical protein
VVILGRGIGQAESRAEQEKERQTAPPVKPVMVPVRSGAFGWQGITVARWHAATLAVQYGLSKKFWRVRPGEPIPARSGYGGLFQCERDFPHAEREEYFHTSPWLGDGPHGGLRLD